MQSINNEHLLNLIFKLGRLETIKELKKTYNKSIDESNELITNLFLNDLEKLKEHIRKNFLRQDFDFISCIQEIHNITKWDIPKSTEFYKKIIFNED